MYKLFGKNRSMRYLFLSLNLLIVISLTGCFFIPKEEEVLAPPLKAQVKITYDFTEVAKGTIEQNVHCTGYLVSVQQRDISFENQNGRLKEVHVQLGSKVKKGQLLAELHTDNLENQIKQQEINLKKAQWSYDELKTNEEKDMALLVIQRDKLKRQLAFMSSLTEAYSQEDIKIAKEQLEEQEIHIKNTTATYEINKKKAEGDIELNRLQLESLKQNLNNSKLISPIDGTVDYIIDAKAGVFIEPYKTVVRVADPHDLQIQFMGEKVSYFELGMKPQIEISGSNFEGLVVATPSNMPEDADEKTRNSIRIQVNNMPDSFRIGESAEINLVLVKKEDVIVIPKNLLHKVGLRNFVYVLDNNIRKEYDVELGIESATEVEVIKGISVGQKLIKD